MSSFEKSMCLHSGNPCHPSVEACVFVLIEPLSHRRAEKQCHHCIIAALSNATSRAGNGQEPLQLYSAPTSKFVR